MESGISLHLALNCIKYTNVPLLDEARVLQKLHIEKLQICLDNVHKEVNATLSEARKKAVERCKSRTGVYPCSLIVGDYVIVSRTKMSANWVGPRRVIKILFDFVVTAEHLHTKETKDLHVLRVGHYADALVGTGVQMKQIANFFDRIWHFVDKIKNIRESNGIFQVLVSWKGLSSNGGSWEPLEVMWEDVPSKVRAHFNRRRKTDLIKNAAESLAI